MLSPNTIVQDKLNNIKVFLKETEQKFLYINLHGITPAYMEKMIGKIYVTSDGNDIWLEQHFTNTKGKTNKKILSSSEFPKLYKMINQYLDEFFSKYAKDIVKNKKT